MGTENRCATLSPVLTLLSLLDLADHQGLDVEMLNFQMFCFTAVRSAGPGTYAWTQLPRRVTDFDFQASIQNKGKRKAAEEFRRNLRRMAPFLTHLFPKKVRVVVTYSGAKSLSWSITEFGPTVVASEPVLLPVEEEGVGC